MTFKRTVSVLATSAVSVVALASAANAQLTAVGAISPDHGYPLYYEDGTDYQGGGPLRLAPCISSAENQVPDPEAPGTLIASPLCLLEPGPAIQVFDANADFPLNYVDPVTGEQTFQDEFFYWHGDAALATAPDAGGDPGRARLVLALEGAFLNDAIAGGDQMVFSRVRFRIDNLVDTQEYTITTPFGVYVENADGVGTRNINVTDDQGGFIANAFDVVLDSTNIGPFLLPTAGAYNAATGEGGPISEVDPVTGLTERWIADPAVPQTVTGSRVLVDAPFGGSNDGVVDSPVNFWRIEGPGVAAGLDPADFEPGQQLCDPALGPSPTATDDCIETNLLLLSGQIANHFGVKPIRATYTLNASAAGRIDVLATSVSGQDLSVSYSGRTFSLFEDPTENGRYFSRTAVNNNIAFPNPAQVTLINNTDIPPTVTIVDLSDVVTVNQAVFDTTGMTADLINGAGTLTVRANSSDNRGTMTYEIHNDFDEPLECDAGAGLTTSFPDNSTAVCSTFTVGKVTVKSSAGGVADQDTLITGPIVTGP